MKPRELWKKVKEQALVAAKAIGVDEDQFTDDTIDRDDEGDLPALIHDDTGLTLGLYENMTTGRTTFSLTGTAVIPGVRYTANGDGWPDDVDVFDIKEWDLEKWFEVPGEFAIEIARFKVNDAIERHNEDKFAETYPRKTDRVKEVIATSTTRRLLNVESYERPFS